MRSKLSISRLRAAGFTAFEAEVLNYAYSNEIAPNSRFCGVPGHARYSTSRQEFDVDVNDGVKLIVTPLNRNKRLIVPSVVNYIAGTHNNNNNNNNNNMASQDNTTTQTQVNNDMMANFAAFIAQQQQAAINSAVAKANEESAAKIAALENELKTAKESGTGTTINVTYNNKTTTTQTEKILDPKFGFILNLLAANKNVYLYGPAGSGKNVICEEAAKALGLDFYYQNTILTKFDVSGYKNAKGEFEETEFYKAWTKGGLFMLDEIDNSTAEALVALNAALANGYYTFADLGKVEKHPNFRCMAAGNTNGQGATDEYCGRYKMDESSRDRFAFVKINYNEKIEASICKDHQDVLEFVHELRKVTKEHNISIICGYRALVNLCDMYDQDTAAVLDAYVIRGMAKDEVHEIAALMSGKNKWVKSLKNDF